MRKKILISILSLFIFLSTMTFAPDKIIELPKPMLKSNKSFEQVLSERRTKRAFSVERVNKRILSQLLWAAQGITDESRNYRTAPSAGALYPLEVYIIVQNKGCEGLENGLYKYIPNENQIEFIKPGDLDSSLANVGYSQDFFARSPICFILTAVPKRTTKKYGERGYRYIHMEVGHVGQNIQLQGTALGLSVGIAGAFKDQKLSELLDLNEEEIPLYIMPVGYPK